MGLLRLMGNKADVVKGLSKRCNENWAVAPKSDIVRPHSLPCSFSVADSAPLPGPLPLRYPGPHHDVDAELDALREDSFAVALQLPRPDLHRE